MLLFTFQNSQFFFLKSILVQFFSYICLDFIFIICYNLDVNLFIHFFLNYHFFCFVLVNIITYRFFLAKFCFKLEIFLYHKLSLVNFMLFYVFIPLFYNLIIFNLVYCYILYIYLSASAIWLMNLVFCFISFSIFLILAIGELLRIHYFVSISFIALIYIILAINFYTLSYNFVINFSGVYFTLGLLVLFSFLVYLVLDDVF